MEVPLSAKVVVVGGGNAGFCAAHAAAERGAAVVLLEKAPAELAGGNSFYTAGAFRLVHGGTVGDGRETLRRQVSDQISLDRLDTTDLEPYSAEQFVEDMKRLTGGRCDAELTSVLAEDSGTLVDWLSARGIRWRLTYERQARLSGGRWGFFGGTAFGTVDGGKGLVAQHAAAARSAGVDLRYEAKAEGLIVGPDGAVRGARYRDSGGEVHEELADSVVLAAGGFESDPDRRARYLGSRWRDALVRGSALNTGEVLDLALGAGAAHAGDWTSCHSVAWDVAAPPEGGDRALTVGRNRQSYPLGIVVNRDGDRFVDEGADFRNYTYVEYGRAILDQPEGRAYQLFDAKTLPLLPESEYGEHATACVADDLESLAVGLGIDPSGLVRTARSFNEAVGDGRFDPARKDGLRSATEPPKSNWAQRIDSPPYYGYPVACGITFTFGGVRIDEEGQVRDAAGQPIEGLYAAGELAGGLFFGNYPSGSGLTAGAVFGRRAGWAAARSR